MFNLSLFFKILVCFSPIYGLLLSYVEINGKKWFILSEIVALIATIFLFFGGLGWYPPHALALYSVFMMLNLAILTHRFGFNNFNKALAVSLILSFITTEVWEFAVFVYGYLFIYGNSVIPIIHLMNHTYVVFSFYLAAKISNLRLTKVNVAILITMLLSSFLFFEPIELIPESQENFNILRTITFLSFASVFYFWSEKKNELEKVERLA